jgi:hypothetical protein
MTTSPLPTAADIQSHVVRVAAETNCVLSDQAVAWIVERISAWIARYTYSEAQALDLIKTWVEAWVQPVDMDGQPITVGTTILAPFAKGGAGSGAHMRRATVVEIGEPEHRGYGYWTRLLKLRALDDGKAIRHLYPKNCLVIAAAPSAA